MTDQLSRHEKVQLEQWIEDGVKTFELIYSINRDGCNPTTFHQLCNNKGPTITVLYNTDGSVFGGYTSVPWRSSGAYQIDYNSFLFRLRYNGRRKYTKFPTKGGTNAIYDIGGYGPCFGGGHDLITFTTIANKSDNYFALNGSININYNYDSRGVQAQEINNGRMQITELEVYKVSDGPKEELVEPWRSTPEWNQEFLETLKDEVENFIPLKELNISQAKILLVGPVGAGKSSFFNTISSIFRGYVTSQACSGSAEHSLTTKYRMYQVRSTASSKPLPFRLCDTRGMEEAQGLDASEISFIIDGNVPDGYQFNPSVPFSRETPGYIKTPSVKDMIHCIAFVLDGSTVDVLQEKTLERMKAMQIKINQIGVPQVILLTKVDKVCSSVEDDPSIIFKTGLISDLVDKVSQVMGLPRGHVLPLKNYERELELDTSVSILSLLALRQILRFSRDFLFNFLDNPDKLGIHKVEIKE
ncbi:hypothetical protein CHS0354_000090 [Potamilus streckersoni]|uniref:TLDc domain-containing protein n=1 Tax=Potamilus streckersoni TaxID=2493646 RepID=A0AAE0RQA6_9BIVA|nr:hypothetical protein CHS0354_000090 [Potamilus streckersoni]